MVTNCMKILFEFTGLGIRSFAHYLLLKIAQIKEQPWAIRLGQSWQKSDCEQIA